METKFTTDEILKNTNEHKHISKTGLCNVKLLTVYDTGTVSVELAFLLCRLGC